MRIDENFDVIHHKLKYGDRRMGMYMVDGFVNDLATVEIMKVLNRLEPQDLRKDPLEKLVKIFITYPEVDISEDLEEVISQVLAGQAALIVEGCTQAILVDIRE